MPSHEPPQWPHAVCLWVGGVSEDECVGGVSERVIESVCECKGEDVGEIECGSVRVWEWVWGVGV